MRGNRLRTVRIAARQEVIRLHDRLGPYAGAVAVLLVGLVFLAICMFLRLAAASDWVSILVAFLVAAATTYVMARGQRDQSILIEVTLSYVMRGGKPYLDSLLAKLIGGTWQREELRPGDALFDVLVGICRGSDWEMRRRVSEALPALGMVSEKRTLELIGILREDWDDRWRGDLRRRAVEALTTPPFAHVAPLIHRVNAERVRAFLVLRDKDQIFTAIALLEALYELRSVNSRMATQLRQDLHGFSEKAFSLEEQRALHELAALLTMCETANVHEVASKLERMATSDNVLVRVAAARNLITIAKRLPDKVLDLMTQLAGDDQKYVRRPLAKERNIDFLIEAATMRAHKERAVGILKRLTGDVDEIIRIAVFDKAERLKESDPGLLREICDGVLSAEGPGVLFDRAKRLREELGAG